MSAIAGRPGFRLKRSQLYPKGRPMDPRFLVQRTPLMDRRTPVASMGSCFAANIKMFLIRRGFNYVQTSQTVSSRPTSAGWGLLFNSFSIAQEFARAENQFEPLETEWPDGNGGLLDPYRRKVRWANRKAALAERANHARSARQAIEQAEVFILTLGLTEIWFNRKDGAVFWQVPPRRVLNHNRHGFEASTVGANVQNLEEALTRLWRLNPGCKVIFTVSPVPLRATFRPLNVVTANMQSKATLLTAVHQVVEAHPERTFYFPSYEIVTAISPNPFKPDNRHVRRPVLNAVMDVFLRSFVR